MSASKFKPERDRPRDLDTVQSRRDPDDPQGPGPVLRWQFVRTSSGKLIYAPAPVVPTSGSMDPYLTPAWRLSKRRKLRFFPSRRALFLGLVLLLLTFVGLVTWEIRTSNLQSRYLSRYAARLDWSVRPGAAASPLQAPQGPYDLRHGYSGLASIQSRLESMGYRVASQAEPSPELQALAAASIAPPYDEKSGAALQIVDGSGRTFFDARPVASVFQDFADIPPLVVQSLLFVEDRKLLDPSRPRLNPALDWDRLVLSSWRYSVDRLFGTGRRSGGSTLATQVQKFRHSTQGRTTDIREKLSQMVGASFAAYRDGESTLGRRRRIVLDYVNGLPLGAAPEAGEVIGLGEGLQVWFGKGLEQLVVDLSMPEEGESLQRKAVSYKQALALLLSTRRPALYLGPNRAPLQERLDLFLSELGLGGIISPNLAAAARRAPLDMQPRKLNPEAMDFVDRRAVNAIRTDLLDLLGMRSLYDLDRLDLRVQTTLNIPAQTAVQQTLSQLRDPKFLGKHGFRAKHLLAQGDPADVVTTFLLYESHPEGNRLLVHADNLDQPLDLNDGAKLELGSTAKLRSMASYLMVIAELHERHRSTAPARLWKVAQQSLDPLNRWAAAYLAQQPETTLEELLQAGLERSFSADPEAQFFTGGGLHRFGNFSDVFEGEIPLRLGFRHSVNLVFIRLMRELVQYHTAELGYDEQAILKNRNHPDRAELLDAAVLREAREHLLQAYKKYRRLDADEALRRLCGSREQQLQRFAIFYSSLQPQASSVDFCREATRVFPERANDIVAAAERLVRSYGNRDLDLGDAAWLMKMPALEIWVVRDRQTRDETDFSELLERSSAARRDAYRWLRRSNAFRNQNDRLRTEIERRAFAKIHASWQKLGYPFGSLLPSLATAIGSSADRPSALAELVGILQNRGLRAPTYRITGLDFASGTPYETSFTTAPERTLQVMPAEVAAVLRELLHDAVENGTARRVRGAFRKPGKMVSLGGKTGSGDNRYETFAADGTLLTSRPINRTASFVFFVGERHYGVITAHVGGEAAGNYSFTSALALQAFNVLAPAVEPLLAGEARHAGAGFTAP